MAVTHGVRTRCVIGARRHCARVSQNLRWRHTTTTPHHLGGGAYEIELTAGPKLGRDSILITADDGVRPVTLMPAYRVEVLDSRVDFDGDGAAGFGDVLAFLQAFIAQDPSADLDGSTTFDASDVLLFVGLFSL